MEIDLKIEKYLTHSQCVYLETNCFNLRLRQHAGTEVLVALIARLVSVYL